MRCGAERQAMRHHTEGTGGAARHAGCGGQMRPCVTARRRRQGRVGQVRECTGPAMPQHTYAQHAHNTHSPARLPLPVGRHPGLCPLVTVPSAQSGTAQHRVPRRSTPANGATHDNTAQRHRAEQSTQQGAAARGNAAQHHTTREAQQDTAQHDTTRRTPNNTTQQAATQQHKSQTKAAQLSNTNRQKVPHTNRGRGATPGGANPRVRRTGRAEREQGDNNDRTHSNKENSTAHDNARQQHTRLNTTHNSTPQRTRRRTIKDAVTSTTR